MRWPHPWWLAAVAVLAVAFGALTIKEGGSVLLVDGAARRAAGNYVPFVVAFNFIAGFAYIVAGAGVWACRRWAVWLSFAIAGATLLVFAAFAIHVLSGGAYEPRTVGAMTLRTGVWLGIGLIARRSIGEKLVRRRSSTIRIFWMAAMSMSMFSSVRAETVSATRASAAGPQRSIFDDIWRFANWYENDDNPVIQSLRFSGRFQLDYALVDGEGRHTEWNIRRFRLGARAKLFEKFTAHGEVELDPREADPVVTRITDLYFQWNQSEALEATIGKHGAPFTMDGSTSSKELLTIDRSNLSNNFWFTEEYLPGLSVSGAPENWSYHAGVYSTGAMNRGFGEFNGSVFALIVVGYDFAERIGVGEAVLAVNYVYQDADEDNSFTRDLENILSVNFALDDERWGIRADLAGATGFADQSDLWGAMAMPFYNVTGSWQLVGRYTFVASRDANGVRLNRYERELDSGRGDRYHELYLGLNYYFYGHRLKLQSGIQFADMGDRANDGGAFSGFAWTSGFRMSW